MFVLKILHKMKETRLKFSQKILAAIRATLIATKKKFQDGELLHELFLT